MANVGEICNREVVFATRETPIITAAKLMRQHHVGTIVIVEQTELTKIVAREQTREAQGRR
ncbi:MAG: hypothetical protein A3G24_08190 [Betaproteobacteria bacterium RIFCSPLOWO2_12_FULL_62_13]|nr:MAG: hypothetical protein A3G24_08190 [Betaproteobacteria bacterium RIFCSPLOWO2_12_FULL_62_13]